MRNYQINEKKQHKELLMPLKKYGVLKEHRQTFNPVTIYKNYPFNKKGIDI